MTPSVAINEIGTASAGMMVAETRRKEQENHERAQAQLSTPASPAHRARPSRTEMDTVVEHVQRRSPRQFILENPATAP